MKNRHCNRFGFTLIELLVVIAIIGLLAAVLVPAIQKAVAHAKAGQSATATVAVPGNYAFKAGQAEGRRVPDVVNIEYELPFRGPGTFTILVIVAEDGSQSKSVSFAPAVQGNPGNSQQRVVEAP